uniref:Uncharacterized protein n=1 Tax=Macaca fascicularis TaxID=9541 RepID=A0A7N9CT15_MACFA
MPTGADPFAGDACIYQIKTNPVSPLRPRPAAAPAALVTLDNLGRDRTPRGGDDPFERLPYQLSMVVAVPTMVTTGDGESGFDSGEGA